MLIRGQSYPAKVMNYLVSRYIVVRQLTFSNDISGFDPIYGRL